MTKEGIVIVKRTMIGREVIMLRIPGLIADYIRVDGQWFNVGDNPHALKEEDRCGNLIDRLNREVEK